MKKRSTSNSKLTRKSSVSRRKSVTPLSITSDNQVDSNYVSNDTTSTVQINTSSSRCNKSGVSSTDISVKPSTTVLNSENYNTTSPASFTSDNFNIDLRSPRSHKLSRANTQTTDLRTPETSPFVNSEVFMPLSVDTPPTASLITAYDDGDDLPATQMLDNRVLKNVIAYVEVRSTNDNRSDAIRKELEQLGATVTKKFTEDVTHVIFKEGSKRTKTKAAKNKCHLVSVLWVDSCKQYQEHVSERLYPAVLPTTNKGTPLFLAKLKKAKSMQPSNFEEEVANSAERCNKRKKQLVEKLQSSECTPQNSPNLGRILVQETQPRTPIDINTPIRLLIPDTPPSMREKMKQIMAKESDTPEREMEEEEPLQRRLFTGVQNVSFESNDVDHLMDGLNDEIKKCIDNMPESPIPPTSLNKPVSSPSYNKDKPSHLSALTSGLNAEKKSPTSKKRRKSVAVVKFADDEVKPKRTSNRRKSVVTFTPSKTVDKDSRQDEIPILIKQPSSKILKGKMNEVSPIAQQSDNSSVELSNINNNADNNVSQKRKSVSRRKSMVTSKKLVDNAEIEHGSSVDNSSVEISNVNNNADNNVSQKRKSVNRRKSMVTSKKLLDNTAIENRSSVDNSEDKKTSTDETNCTVARDYDTCDQQEKIVAGKFVISVDAGNNVISVDSVKPQSSIQVTSSIDIDNTTSHSVRKKGPQRTNSKKKLLPLSDLDPDLPLLSKTPDAYTPTRKRQWASCSGLESNISALFPTQSPKRKQARKGSLSEKMSSQESHPCATSSNNIVMPDELTLQETTINSSTATQNDNSMSLAYGDSILSSQSGRYAPRPSIDEFNLARGIKHMRRPRPVSTSSYRKSDSDSSDNSLPKKIYRRSPPTRPSLVMTSLHAEEQDLIISVVKRLGHFVISDNVTETTTHLICGGPRRTLNVLYGIMRGIMIVHKQWVLSSLEAQTWLPGDDYEATDYFPVAKVTREGRYLQKENYRSLSLHEVGTIYLAQKTSPPRHHLLNLLKLCGARVTNSQNKASIYLGHEFLPDKICVNPVWVLDCITQQQLLNVDRYLLGRPKRESSPEF
ncbi:microcephalin [Mytilus galloprovincialis]|uniref:Microcephalin n=1 Tax=Mytilus galloprovincialis TaxID=29158 RepID=A0A8B6BIB8_MYTGA|nr:microcephalin [Mytilus galloprovincialis]